MATLLKAVSKKKPAFGPVFFMAVQLLNAEFPFYLRQQINDASDTAQYLSGDPPFYLAKIDSSAFCQDVDASRRNYFPS